MRVEKAAVAAKNESGSTVRLFFTLEKTTTRHPENLTLVVRMFDYANGVESGERTILRQDLAAPLPERISADIRVANASTKVIQAEVAGGVPGAGFSHVDRAYLVSGAEGNVSLLTPADFKHQENLANINKLRKRQKPHAEGATASGWPLTVTMEITYADSSGSNLPLANATAEVWEEDTLFDDFLGKVVLDASGKATTTVGVPFDAAGSDDVYLLIKTEDANRFTLGTAAQSSGPVTPYQYQTATQRVRQESPPISFNFTISSGARELGVWSQFNGIRDYIAGELNFTTRPFKIWFPSSKEVEEAYFSRKYNLIAISDSFAKSDVVMAHEFGHVLMWQINDEWMPEAGGPHGVCPGTAIDNKLAWTEGYATAFALSATHSSDGVFHWTPDDYGLSVEHYDCGYHQLDTDEIRVAAAIWDLVDAPDDCNGGSADRGRDDFCDKNRQHPIPVVDAYYNAVKGQKQETTMPYWWYLHDKLMTADQKPLAENIMKYDWSAYSDSAINSFTCKCVDTRQRCASNAYDFMCDWNVTGHSCQTSVRINQGSWMVRSTDRVGRTGGVVGPNNWYAIKVLCQGWGTAEKTLYEPPNM